MTAPGVRVWQEQNYSAASASANVGTVFPGMKMPFEDRTDLPSLTIRNHVKAIMIERGVTVAAPLAELDDRPPYRVMTMAELRALSPNGFDAVSTFSGCGGSSTGYRMAGFRMLWASEFVEAARDTYRANAAEYTVLDARDIRDVTGDQLLEAAGKAVGEIDLFDGSPPCASFSTSGAREKGWGKVKNYSDREQRSDDLFFEFARLIEETQPRTFVAENVSGLVKGTAKGYFKLILRRLRACGYRVEARLLDASWLGVPQARQRLIFVGVREDLGMDPVFPKPLPYQYTVCDALPWITGQGDNGGFGGGSVRPTDKPSPTIGATTGTGNNRFPPSLVEALVPSLVMRNVTDGKGERVSLNRPAPTLMASGIGGVAHGQAMLAAAGGPDYGEDGLARDPETGQKIGLENLAIAKEYDASHPGQARPQVERRRFTLRELRAIGGFPPDFVLTGSYAQRWERIGRAVPPVMMAAIAATLRDEVLVPLRERGVI